MTIFKKHERNKTPAFGVHIKKEVEKFLESDKSSNSSSISANSSVAKKTTPRKKNARTVSFAADTKEENKESSDSMKEPLEEKYDSSSSEVSQILKIKKG